LSLEDDLMRIFASDRVRNMMKALGMEKGEAIEHKMVSNAIEKAQRKVEGRNFDIRKQLLEYDDVANDQRSVIYDQRNELMSSDDISETIDAIREEVVNDTISTFIPPESLSEQWDIPGLEEEIKTRFAIEMPIQQWLDEDDNLYEETLRARILDQIVDLYREKEALVGTESFRNFEKQVMLQVLDQLWKEHLQTMDLLRRGIHLRGYAQKNPKQEYKRESFELFQGLLESIKSDVVRIISHVQVRAPEDVEEMERQRREAAEKQAMDFKHDTATGMQGETSDSGIEGEEQPATFKRDDRKVGRNEPCPCGSGKKYKACHGKIA
jgi:preprotein translocase subunit SecA